jgi:competence protein ComEC
VKVLPSGCGSRFWAIIYGLRTKALKQIEALYPNNPYAVGMMDAILLGETTKLEKIWTEHFRRTGTFHALVISGMHVSVLAGSLLFLMRICFIPEMPALFATALAAWLYALVSGWSAPVVRAAGGFSLYLVCRYFYRRGRVMNLLAAVALGYLLYDPGQMFESSFQLSFLSVAAIGVLAIPLLEATTGRYSLQNINETNRDPRLMPQAAALRVEVRLLAETAFYWVRVPVRWGERAIAFWLKVCFYVFDMVAISSIVQIGLALPMAIYFHRISFSGLSANVLIVPLLSAVIPIGFLAVFTSWHPPAFIAERLLRMAESVANWHVQWEPATRVPDPPLWLSITFVTALLLLTFAIRRSWRWQLLSVIVVLGLFAVIFIHPFEPRLARGKLELSAIDVGQGDGLLLSFPDGKILLVDAGGFPNFTNRKSKPKLDIGEDVVSPYLWSRSIKKIDVVVCTHAHEDHIGGVGAVIDNFHPSQLWTGADSDNPVWDGISDHALARHVRIQSMTAGQSFDFGGTHIDVLSPPADYQPPDSPKNNDSLVMRITYGKHKFLLTGDVEKQMEWGMLADGRLGHVDVLKVAHHGSNTSSTDAFLDAVQPAFAVISDGFENSFHHPHPMTLQRLREHHASILRTDQLGPITIRSDGRHLSLETAITAR